MLVFGADFCVPQVVEQIIEVSKMKEEIFVFVPEMVEQLVKLPKTVFPVAQDVEDLVEVSRVFLQDRIQQCFEEQTEMFVR